MADIHTAAAIGYNANASEYATGRPDYPSDIIGWLSSDVSLSQGSIVLDLGAGTGKFISSLQATGSSVIAIEPVAAMRAEFSRAHPQVDIRPGTAEAIPLPDNSMDAIVCAQAFHWFANHAALAEIHRVLKPGGTLALIWNVRDESIDWVSKLTEIMAPYTGDAPRFYTGAWRLLFPANGFTALCERRFCHAHVGPAERVIVDRTISVSFIAALPAAEQGAIAKRVRELIASTPAIASGGDVIFPYVTCAFSCRKRAQDIGASPIPSVSQKALQDGYA